MRLPSRQNCSRCSNDSKITSVLAGISTIPGKIAYNKGASTKVYSQVNKGLGVAKQTSPDHYQGYNMSKSLQDQLLKAGLVDKKKANQIKKDQHKKKKTKQKSKETAVDETKLSAQQAIQEKAERDRLLNLELKAEAEKKAITAQIKQLIELNKINKGDGEVGYNFTDEKKIKKIYVTETLQIDLSKGRLAIVRLNEGYELVPKAIAEKIMLRDESCIAFLAENTQQEMDEDDPYADYQIPDDLMW